MNTENENNRINIDPNIERAVDEIMRQESLESIWSDLEGLIDGCSKSVERSSSNARFFLNRLALDDRSMGGRVFYFAATQRRKVLLRFLWSVGVSPISVKGSYASWPLRGALRARDDESCLRLLAAGHRLSMARRYVSTDAQDWLSELLEKRSDAAELDRKLPLSTEGEGARVRF